MMAEADKQMRSGIQFNNDDGPYQALFVVHHHLNLIFEDMKQSLNGLNNSPQMVYSQLILVLKDKGPTGVLIAKAIEREVNATLQNPEATLKNTSHGLTYAEMNHLKANGAASLTTRHFTIIMTSLLEKAQRGEPIYIFDNISELQKLSNRSTGTKRAKPKVEQYEELEESYDEDDEDLEALEDEETMVPVQKKKKSKTKITTLSVQLALIP
jgi:hypothetical protein